MKTTTYNILDVRERVDHDHIRHARTEEQVLEEAREHVRRVEEDEGGDEVERVGRQQRNDDIAGGRGHHNAERSGMPVIEQGEDAVAGSRGNQRKRRNMTHRKVEFVKISPTENVPPLASIASRALTIL